MFTEMDYRAETKAYYKEGKRDKALEDAQNFLAAGVPAEIVASCTGLNMDEVREMSMNELHANSAGNARN